MTFHRCQHHSTDPGLRPVLSAPPELLSLRSQLGVIKGFFSQYFIETACVLARALTSGGNGYYPDGGELVVTTNTDLIPHFDRMGRFRRTAIDRDATGVTEFLRQCASSTKAARLEKEIETQEEFQVSSFKFQELGKFGI